MAPSECEYVQIPPSISQPCRLNLAFCNPDPNYPQQWKPVGAWDGKATAFGWVVMNYADYGMQFFVEDGTFYREVRFGGPLGFVKSPAWTPFARPERKPSNNTKRTQLDLVIESLIDSKSPGYMKAFYRMITFAFGEMKPANSSYAQYMNSIVGRPLALVNIGMSLELAVAPFENESEPGLLQKYTLSDGSTPKPISRQCSFPVQIGDRQRSYDGLLGFWKPTPEVNPPKELAQRGKTEKIDKKSLLETFDYSQLYTFWSDPENCSNIHEITPATLKLAPFYIPPDEPAQDSTNFVPINPEEQSLRRNSHLQAISALIDPFTAVHAFTSILPLESITLPRWSIEAALGKMTTFFHLGPVLVTSNVSDIQDKFKLDSESDTRKVPTVENIGLPALDAAQWSWLQPYVHDKKPDPEYPLEAASRSSDAPTATPESGVQISPGADPSAPEPPTGDKPPWAATPDYIPLDLLPVDTRPRLQPAPYLAVEGYLQLGQPLAASESDVNQE